MQLFIRGNASKRIMEVCLSDKNFEISVREGEEEGEGDRIGRFQISRTI